MTDYFEYNQSQVIEVNDNEEEEDDVDSQNQQNHHLNLGFQHVESMELFHDKDSQSQNSSKMHNYQASNNIDDHQNESTAQLIQMIQGYFERNKVPQISKQWLSGKNEFLQGLFAPSIIDMKEHTYKFKINLNGKEVFYSFIVWIILEQDKAKAKIGGDYCGLKDVLVQQKMNSILKLIRERRREVNMMVKKVPSSIIQFLIKQNEDLNQANLILTLLSWINNRESNQHTQMNYIIASCLIRLNQLEEAEFIVHQMLLLYEDNKSFNQHFQYLYLILAFQCFSDSSTLTQFYNESSQSMLNLLSSSTKKDTQPQKEILPNLFQLLLQYCLSLKRLGEPQKLRETIHEFGKNGLDKQEKLFKANLIQLYELVIYTNRLPQVAKILYQEPIIENTIDLYPQDTKNFIQMLNQCLITEIANGETEYKFILQIIQVGQDYKELIQEAKEQYVYEQYKELDDIQQKNEYFIQKENQFMSKYVRNWITDVKKGDEDILLENLRSQNQNGRKLSNYIRLLNILKLSGQYSLVVKVVDVLCSTSYFKHLMEEFNCFQHIQILQYLLNEFLIAKTSPQPDTSQIYYEYFECAESLNLPLEQNKDMYEELFKQTHSQQITDEFNVFSDIIYTKALSLMYLKQYEEALATCQQIMLAIIQREGIYSYSLIPFLHLQSELATYNTLKTLSFISKHAVQKILNNNDVEEQQQEDDDSQISRDYSFLINEQYKI